VEHQLAGESFARFVLAGGWEEPPPALQEAELYGPGGDFALTMWPWRLHVQPMDRWVDREAWDADPKALEGTERVMLFNLDEDPKEQHDVAAEYPDRVAGMRQRAETLIAEARERRSGSNDPGEMNVEADADFNLGVLGYADR
jgi:hypothetical protein